MKNEDELISALDLNRKSYNQILFRPRILINVEECNTSTKMLGQETSLPIFVAPAGMAGLAWEGGERGLARGAGEAGIIQMVSVELSEPSEARRG
jgi:L-lactate dehydrogenase (cytochrome)